MKKVQGFTRPQGLRERVQVLEGAVDALFQTNRQITQQMQSFSVLLQAFGDFAGGEAAVQPFIDAVVARMNRPANAAEEVASAPAQENQSP